MGTTLHARVEILFPAVPSHHLPERWQCVARWSLEKDYELMAVLHRFTTPDWPLDARGRSAPENDFHRYWMNGRTVIDGLSNPSPQWRALCASLRELTSEHEARVLYLEL